MSDPAPIRIKQKEEARTITFEFADKLNTGDYIPSPVNITITSDSGITTSTPQLDGNPPTLVSTRIGGGVEGFTYKVSCIVITQQGDILELDVNIKIKDGVN